VVRAIYDAEVQFVRCDPELIALLCCPRCQGGLDFLTESEIHEDGHVEAGQLSCRECQKTYPIIDGVPRFVPASLAHNVNDTVEGFGFQWNRAKSLVRDGHLSSPEVFLEYIEPIAPEYFKDKVVLDAGCGTGRFVQHAVDFGGRLVVGVDLSSSVDVALENTRHLKNVLIVQADIFQLPLREAFNYVFSLGVLHHTHDPKHSFAKLVVTLVPDGAISAWVYGREGNGWIIAFVNPLRYVTSRLPRHLLVALSFVLGLPLYVLSRLVGVLPKHVTGWLSGKVQFTEYLNFLRRFDFREQAHMIFDHLVPQLTAYIRREEFADWFAAEGLQAITISQKTRNSWRGFGVKSLLEK